MADHNFFLCKGKIDYQERNIPPHELTEIIKREDIDLYSYDPGAGIWFMLTDDPEDKLNPWKWNSWANTGGRLVIPEEIKLTVVMMGKEDEIPIA